jgi:hypothetical protein
MNAQKDYERTFKNDDIERQGSNLAVRTNYFSGVITTLRALKFKIQDITKSYL